MNFLESNWKQIKEKVVIPLWNKKYKSMYEKIKMDFDDFESLAAIELTKAMKSFNPDKSNLFTYATNVINKKATTELRNCTKRDVRKASHISHSVDAMDRSIIENIPCPEAEERSELSELRVGNFINSLNNNQLRVLILNLLEFDVSDMSDMLNISNRTVTQIFNSLKDADLTRVLYRRNF
jgi:RNA polymerase sigma factor (sigma-70 family)